jgi:hypothetical protein
MMRFRTTYGNVLFRICHKVQYTLYSMYYYIRVTLITVKYIILHFKKKPCLLLILEQIYGVNQKGSLPIFLL